jgi:transposase InsO family protein
MNSEENFASEKAPETTAGKAAFERSENAAFPAGPPDSPGVEAEDTGGVPPLPVPDAPGLESDGVWEDAWPRPATPAEEVPGLPDSLSWGEDVTPPKLKTRRRGTLAPAVERPQMPLSPQQKLLLLDTWQRSGLPARDFGALVNISRQTLYAWKRRFEELGPAGLIDRPKGVKQGSKLPELTKRAILMLKQAHPEWGCERISDMLVRGPALPASPNAVARVLREAGYVLVEQPTKPHPDHIRSFERAKPNQLWQTDLFTFVLKRQNRRVYLVAFLDDHSRFITGYGLHGSQSTPLVIEVLRAAIAAYGVPAEILTDNGTQYVTWRGKSQFTKELEKLGVKQIVAKPKRPQTLGKVERFWGTLWRECVERAVFLDLEDARRRIGLFIDHYNFQRVHSGIDGLVPADRFFHAAPQVLATLKQRVAENALELSRHGVPKQPFYLTGQVEGKPFSVHQAGDRVILQQAGTERSEIELVPPVGPAPDGTVPEGTSPQQASLPAAVCPQGVPTQHGPLPEELPPGVSALDDYLAQRDPPQSGGDA